MRLKGFNYKLKPKWLPKKFLEANFSEPTKAMPIKLFYQ